MKEASYFAPLRFGPAPLAAIESYRELFAHSDGEPWLMEATPAYFYGGARLIDAMQAILDEPRIVVLLREPVERLWSEYRYLRSRALIDGSNG